MSSGKLTRRLKFLLVFFAFSVGATFAQKVTLKGDVKTKDGKAIEAATVRIDGINGSVVYTDTAGVFSITAKKGEHLVVERVGYKPETILVDPEKLDYSVVLEESSAALDEIVVTANGETVRKREQGYTSTTLKASEIVMSKPQSIAGALAGRVPGLDISAVGGGVNPNYRLILRGQRSITGNNNALIVLDNVIVPSDVLNNINPEDIESMTVLNGSSGVALYGSQASNGAIIVTTKKAKQGPPQVNISNTSTLTTVAFLPKYQKEFGSGGEGYSLTEDGYSEYVSLENQSYGTPYDGSLRQLGAALEDGSILTTPYSYFEDRAKFWQKGYTNQSDFSISGADDKSSIMFSGQWLTTSGIVWKDKYTRAVATLNGGRKFLPNLELNYKVSYTQNRYNTTSALSTVYDQFNNMPGWIPITRFKNWRTDPFANPNGYYNPWYGNPYFTIENNRSYVNNDYLISALNLKWSPTKWLSFTSRTGYETRTIGQKNTTGKFTYTDYAIEASGGSKSDIAGYNYDYNGNNSQLFQTMFAEVQKKVNDFSLYLMVKGDLQKQYLKYTSASVSGLTDSAIFNLSNSQNNPSASSNYYQARQLGATYEFKLGYKNYLFFHTTGRKDWVSILDPDNRSFFYPAFDVSFVASDAIDALKNLNWLNVLKLRASWSKVGQVNLINYTYGAYALTPTFSQGSGYPFNGVSGYTVGSVIVQPGLKPEMTKGWEFGTDFTLLDSRVDGSFTYFTTTTNNQTMQSPISTATGFSYYLGNAGATANKGIETKLSITVIDNKDVTLTLAGNYTHTSSMVTSLNPNLQQLTLASYSYSYSIAVPGMQWPQIYGTDYQRDDQGRVIVNKTTGRPIANNVWKYLGNANAKDIIGFIPSFRYKSLSFSAVLEYRGGMKRYNEIGRSLAWSGMGINTVKYNRKDFVFPNSVYLDDDGNYVENTNIVVNQGSDGFWTSSDYRNVASNFVTNGAYIKVRQLSVAYSVPQSLLRKTSFIKAATVSVQGRNLFIFTPKDNVYTDPEYSAAGSDSNAIGLTGYDSPPQRYYGATISLTF
ncbi:MAG: SusC/RagA family TonB-linked outer membrane protein [Chitinophagaceae bacterium]